MTQGHLCDLVRSGHGWKPQAFTGSNWQNVNSPERQSNLLNTYRVLRRSRPLAG